MDTILNEKYAQLILNRGINLQKGQCIRIMTTVDSYHFALTILDKAYSLGAKFVKIEVASDYTTLHRANNSQKEFIDYIPDYEYANNNMMIAENWAFISITNTDEFDVLNNANTENVQSLMRNAQITRKKLRDKLMSDKQSWIVVAYPGPKWAERIYGSSNELHKLEEVFKKIMRLDKDDVETYWNAHSNTLINRCHYLNDLHLDKLIFKNKSDELEIGLNTTSIWHGGPAKLPDGRLFMPNMPTEEVFTTPDFTRTNGTISVVKPVDVFGTTIKDLKLEFKKGEVINFSCSKGMEMMEKYLSIDKQAKFLGEVALVDKNSPINTSTLFFNSILFDENASSHIALGAGYPSCIKNNQNLLSDDDRLSAGCNVSSVHTDFMIGNEDTSVTGFTTDGKAIQIMKDGSFIM